MKAWSANRGGSLVETMIAVLIALVGVFSLGSVIFQSTATSKNQGTEVTRSTIYAQDKIENLLSLNFTACTQVASSQPASCNTTGITETGWTQGLLAGGELSPRHLDCPSGAPGAGYTDYLDANGLTYSDTTCTAAIGSKAPSYIRQWKIEDVTTDGPALKRITVAVFSLNAVNAAGGKPIVLLTSELSNPN